MGVEDCLLDALERRAALPAAGGLEAEAAIRRAARLARRLLDAPAALVSLAAPERTVVDSVDGLPEPLASLRDGPLWHALGRQVAASNAPFIVADARDHPLAKDDPACPAPGTMAYLGVPLAGPDGSVLGTLAVMDSTARDWSEQDIAALADLSRAAAGEIAARFYRDEHQHAEARTTEILESIDAAFYTIDREWRFLYVNREAERLWQRRREDLLGRVLLETFPAFEGSDSHRAHQRALAEGRPVRIETVSAISRLPLEINIFPSPSGLSVYFRDLSERRRMEEALRERDEALTLAERSAEIGIWDVDLASGMARATPQFFRNLGLEPVREPVPIETFRAFRHPEDRQRVIQGFFEAVESGADYYEIEYRIIRTDGELRWIFGRGRVVRDAGGKPVRYSGVDIDVTERKRLEERQRLLLTELNHRVKNTLATVQSIARRSLEDGRPLRHAREAFLSRLQALAHTHNLLTESEWRGAELRTLVEAELSPYGARAGVEGQDLVLVPKAALTLGLIIHELATNAAKHGALSVPGGRVELSWAIEEGRRFRLRWRERGGPPVRSRVRRGFGWTLLERAATYDLRGSSSLELAAEGVRYELTAPLEELAP